MWLKTDTRRPLAVSLGLLSALAWLALWLWGRSPYSRFLSHHGLETVRGNLALAPFFVLSWVTMIVAMMLPTSLPLLAMFQTVAARQPRPLRLMGLLAAGYLGVWLLCGAALYGGDWILHQAVEHSHWLADRAWMIGGATLVLAGAYQFTPLKYHCLDQCRSPLSFIARHWHGTRPAREALALGAHHGLFCVGCCWSLMLLMFAVGAGSLAWMLVLGAAMAAEKNLPSGRRISAPLGVILIIGGAIWLLSGAPAHVQ